MDYRGYKVFRDNSELIAGFYEGEDFCVGDFLENQYLIVEDEDGKLVDCFRYYGEDLGFDKVPYPIIGNQVTGKYKPRNPQQYCMFDLLKDRNIPIKLITGKFGTGKTLGCVVSSLEAVQNGEFEKIVFVRNNIQVRDTDPIGALPGDQFEKMLPWALAFADHCGGLEGLQQLIEAGQFEIVPLAFLRGRDIRNSIIYSMESENLTKEQVQLIMGRVGEGSEVWFDGDLKQRDRSIFEKSQGLEKMIEKLAGRKQFGYVHLLKSERSEVAAMADLLDD